MAKHEYPRKPINIILLTYGLHDYFCGMIERIHERTQYPHRVVVGDNKSWGSDAIRTSIRQFIKEGKVSKAYLYGENYKLNSYKHIFDRETKAYLTVMVDGDTYLPDMDECWLTKFVGYMDDNHDIAQIGFKGNVEAIFKDNPERVATSYYEPARILRFLDTFNRSQVLTAQGKVMHGDIARMLTPEIRERCSNLHFALIRTRLLDEYFKKSKRVFSDGGLCQFVLRKRQAGGGKLLQCRYEAAIAQNMSHLVTAESHPEYYQDRIAAQGAGGFQKKMKINKVEVIE